MSLRPLGPIARQSFVDSGPPFCLHAGLPATTSLSLNYLVILQNQALQQIADQNLQISALINRISERPLIRCRPSPKENPKPSEPEAKQNGDDCRLLKIVLEEELQLPILKERGFTLIGSVKGPNNELAPQAAGTRLSISLYTQDTPARPLLVNIAGRLYSGKKALRGTILTEVRDDGTFQFANIVVNEVSSHYIDDVFSLVVSDESNELKPLVIKRLAVRARKAKVVDAV